ncbi:MAG: tetratricopeptide repeat-containing protein [Cyanobacteria bacterium P01_A01_bin.116]
MKLSPENEDALEDLLVGIEANGSRLGIFIAVCDDPQLKKEIISRYEEELSPEFRHYRLTIDKDEPNIKGMIAQVVEDDEALQPGVPAVMTLLGSEQLFSLRFGEEKSQQEEFFGYLQWTREGLRSLPYAMVLWITYSMQKSLGRRAPDFWSWRQDVVRFVSPKRSAIAVDRLDSDSYFKLNLPEEVGETLPVADLEALIANTEAKSPDSPLLASLYLQVGKAYAARLRDGAAQNYVEEIEKATIYLEKSAALAKKDEPSEDYISSIGWLANLYESQGRYEEAEPLYLQDLEMSRKLLGEEHPDVATSLNNLANLYRSQGRYEEAEPLYIQALEQRRKLLGEEHPSVATSLNNLGALYFSKEDYVRAEPLFVESLAIRDQKLGRQHPWTVGTRQWLEATRSHLP